MREWPANGASTTVAMKHGRASGVFWAIASAGPGVHRPNYSSFNASPAPRSRAVPEKLRQKSASPHLRDMPRFAIVMIDDSGGDAFDYELPEPVAAQLQVGSRVRCATTQDACRCGRGRCSGRFWSCATRRKRARVEGCDAILADGKGVSARLCRPSRHVAK